MSNSSDSIDSTKSLTSFFDRRKSSFLASLQHILAAVTSDLFIQQMFEDPASAMYIPDRVCELVGRYLRDDREAIIQDLICRIRALEACFGTEKMDQIEEIGRKILDSISNSKNDVAQRPIQFQQQLQDLIDFSPKTNNYSLSSLTKMKQNLSQILEFLLFMKEFFSQISGNMRSSLQAVKKKTKGIITSLVSQLVDSQQREQQYKQQLDEATKRFNKIDIPRIRKRYEEEIERHVQNEENLQKSLNKLKKVILKITQEHSSSVEELNALKETLAKTKNVSNDLNITQAKISEQEGIIFTLKNELKQKQQQIESLLNETQSLNAHQTALQESIAKSNIVSNDKDTEIQQLKEKIVKMQIEMDKKENAVSLNNIDIQMLKSKASIIPTIEKVKNDAIQKVNSLQTENTLLEQSTKKLEEQLIFANKEKQRLLNEMSQNHSNEIAKISSEKEDLSKKNSIYLSEIQQLKDSINDQLEKINQFEIDNNQLREENKAQTLAISEREDALILLRDQYNALFRQNEEMQSTISSFNDQTSDISTSLQAHQKKLRQKDREIAEIQNEKKKVDQELKEVQKKLMSVLHETQNSANAISQSNESLLYAQDEIKKKNQIIADLMKQNEQANSVKAEQSNTIDDLHQELTSAASKIESRNTKIKSLSQQLQSFQEQNNSLVTNIQKYDEKLKNAIEEKYKLEKQNMQLRKEIQQYQTDMEIAQSNSSSLQTKVAQLNNDLKISKENLELVEKVRNKILNEKKQIQDQTLDDRKRYKEDMSSIQSQLSKALSEKDQIEHELEKAQLEITSLNSVLKQKDDDIKYEKEKSGHDFDIIKKQNEVLSANYSKLQENYNNLNKKVKTLRKNISEVYPSCESIEQIPQILSDLQNHKGSQGKLINTIRSIIFPPNSNKVEKDDIEKIVDSIQTMKNENSSLKEREKQLLKMLPENQTPDNLIPFLNEMKNETEQLKTNQEGLLNLLNINNPRKLNRAIQKMKEENKIVKEIEDSVKKLLPNSSIKTIPNEIENLQKAVNELKKKENELISLLEIDNSVSIPNALIEMKKKLTLNDDIISQLSQIVPSTSSDGENGLVSAVSKLKNSQVQLLNEQNQIKENIPDRFSDKPLLESISLMKSENEALKAEKDAVLDLIPNGEGCLSNRVLQVLNELSDMKHDKESIKLLVGDENTEKKIESMLQTIDNYETQEHTIESILPKDLTGTLPQKISKLAQAKLALSNENNMIQKLLSPASNASSISGQVTEVLKKLSDSTHQLKSINDSLPDEIKDSTELDLPSKVSLLSHKYSELKETTNNLHHLFSDDIKGDELDEKIADLLIKSKEMEKLKDNLKQLIPADYSNSDEKLEDQFSEIVNQYNSLRKEKYEMMSIIPDEFKQGNDIKSQVRDIVSELSDLKNKQKNCDKLIPKEIKEKGNDFDANVSSLINQYNALKNQQERMNSIIPEEFKQNEKSVEKQLSNAMKQFNKLKKEQEKIESLIPAEFSSQDKSIKKQLSKLVDQYNNNKKNKEEIEKIIPVEMKQNNEDLANQITNIMKDYERIRKQQETIKSILPKEMAGNQENEESEEELEKQIIKLSTDFNSLRNQQEKIKSILPNELKQNVDENDIVKPISSLVSNYNDFKNQQEMIKSFIPKEFQQNDESIENQLSNFANQFTSLRKQHDKFKSFVPTELKQGEKSLDKQLRNLANQYNALQNQIESIHSIIPDEIKQRENDDIENEVSGLVNQYRLMKDQLENIESTIPNDIKQNGESIDNQLSNLADNYNAMKKQQDKIQSFIPAEIKQNEKSLEKQIANLTNQFNALKKQHESLKSKIPDDLKQNEDDLENQFSFLSDQYNNMKKMNENLKSIIPEEIQQSKGDLEDQLVYIAKKFNKMRNQHENLKSIIPDELKQNEKSVEKQLANAMKQFNKYRKELEKLQSLIPAEFASQNKSVKKQLSKLVEEYKNNKKENEEMKQNNDKLANHIAKLKKEQETIKSALNNNENDDDDDESSLGKQIGKLSKEFNSLKNQQEKIKSIIPNEFKQNVDENDLEKQISNLSNQFNALRNQQEAMKSFIPDELKQNGKELGKQLSNLANEYNNLIERQEEMKALIPKEMRQNGDDLSGQLNNLSNQYNNMKCQQEKIKSIIPKEFKQNGEELDKQVSNLVRHFNNLKEQQESINDSLNNNVFNDQYDLSAKEKMDKLMKCFSDLQKENNNVRSQLLIPSNGSVSDTLSKLLKEKRKIEKIISSLDSIIPAEFEGDFSNKIQEMIKERDDIISTVNQVIEISDDLPLNEAVTKLVDYHKILLNLGKMLPVKNIDEIPVTMQNILDTQKKLQKLFKSKDIVASATNLQDQLKQLHEIFDEDRNNDESDNINNLIENARNVTSILQRIQDEIGCNNDDDIIEKVEQYKCGLDSANELLSGIISVFPSIFSALPTPLSSPINKSNSFTTPVSSPLNKSFTSYPSYSTRSQFKDIVEFPLTKYNYDKLIKFFIDLNNKYNDIQNKVSEVMLMAKGVGYLGEVLMEAVIFIRDTAIEDEKQRSMERMNVELTSMRSIHERERNLNEKQKEKLKKKIADQREMIAQVQEKMVQKEDEFHDEIEKQQKIARMATNESELQKRIHEELIRMIAGQPIDGEYLKTHLDPKEIRLIMENDKAAEYLDNSYQKVL